MTQATISRAVEYGQNYNDGESQDVGHTPVTVNVKLFKKLKLEQ